MKTRHDGERLRVGFVVEGNRDRFAVEALARRVWHDALHMHTVPLGGRASVPWLWSTVMTLLDEKDYDHVVVVLDADSTSEETIEYQREVLWQQLADHRVTEDEATIILAVPELESWLLSDQIEAPESSTRTDFAARFGGRDPALMAQVAERLDLEVGRKRSKSLDRFLSTLEALGQKHAA